MRRRSLGLTPTAVKVNSFPNEAPFAMHQMHSPFPRFLPRYVPSPEIPGNIEAALASAIFSHSE